MYRKRGAFIWCAYDDKRVSLVSCSNGQIKDALNYQIQPFEYQNQEGQKVSLDDLRGKYGLQILFSQAVKRFVRL